MKDIDKLIRPNDRKYLMHQNTKFTPEMQELFLVYYKDSFNKSDAAKKVGISPKWLSQYLRTHPEFAEKVDEAFEAAVDNVEEALYNRAVKGINKPVYWQGQEIAVNKEFSDTAAIFLLKGNRPEKYRDNKSIELTGKDGGPIEVSEVKSKLLSMLKEDAIDGEIVEE